MPRCSICHRRVVATCPDHGVVVETPLRADDLKITIPNLELGELLGAGGTAAVWAVDLHDRMRGVVKIARSPMRGALADEAQRLRVLDGHPTPRLIVAGHAGRDYLVLERARGTSLAKQLERGSIGLETLDPIAKAVDDLHRAGFVHCDLKPENVFLDERGCTLVDLGTARAIATRTETVGERPGTPTYMAPEQIDAGRHPITPAVDVYALGVIAFEGLCGRPPFVGSVAAVKHGHAFDRPPRASAFVDIDPRLEAVIARCLAKDPTARFGSASAAIDALRSAVNSTPVRHRFRTSTHDDRPAGRERVVLAGVHGARWQELANALDADAHVCRHGEPFVVAFPGEDLAMVVRSAIRFARRIPGGHSVVHCAELDVARGSSSTRVRGAAVSDPSRWSATTSEPVVLTAEAAAVLEPGLVRVFGDHYLPVETADDPVGTETVGRDDVLVDLLRDATAARSRPILRVVTGDPGVGKTRILRELASRLSAAGTEPLWITGDPAATTRPVLDLIAHVLGVHPHEVSIAGRAAFGDVWDAVRVAIDAAPSGSALPVQLELAPGAQRSVAAVSIGRTIRDAAKRAPLVVLVDNAHHVAPIVLDSLEVAATSAIGLYVVATGAIERNAWPAATTLAPLDHAASAQLVRALLHPVQHVANEIVDEIVTWSGGNPLALVELLTALRESGVVRRQPGTRAWFVAASMLDSARRFIGQRGVALATVAARAIDHLSMDLLPLAQVCAIADDPIDPGVLRQVVEELDSDTTFFVQVDVGVGLRRLERHRVLEPVEHGYRFRLPFVRERVLATLDAEQRTRLHLAFVRSLAEPADQRALATLARHLRGAGRLQRAAQAYVQLATRAAARHRYVDAERAATEAIALGADAPAYMLRAQARYRTARFDDALADLRIARDGFTRLGDAVAVATATLEECTILDWANRWDDGAIATACAADAVASLGAAHASRTLAGQLALAQGRVAQRAGRHDEARERLALAAELASEDYGTEIVARLLLAVASASCNELDRASAELDTVFAKARAAGDLVHVAAAHNNRVIIRCVHKDLAGAQQDLEASIAIARELGNGLLECHCHYNLGEMLIWIDHVDAALASAERAFELCLRDSRPIPHVGVLLARVAVARGDRPAARASLLWVASTFREDELPVDIAVFRDMAAAFVDDAALAQWKAIVDRTASMTINEQLEVLAAATRYAGDAALLLEARRRVADDPVWLRRFS